MQTQVIDKTVGASLLAAPDLEGHVVRVPDLAVGIDWWTAATGFRVRVRRAFGDLAIAAGATSDGVVIIIVGGPGALEYALTDNTSRDASPAAVIDPWGNHVRTSGPGPHTAAP